ncbi:hypothetical protein PTTG_30106 [Puccinia triticina 1-1 BBBD Race 1]|uniref:Uncharacterized protein n=2 Tax=Puccinia triticina TaxID=208348 RepID=A0A180G2J7_PUCT1|nr:uncharacterized protein PtA15_13A101 [Puccinia triticina]OAV86063.1 hypothetical protein PTTG_30106 [Puccinia triticina 1-1 BBBD Race 1]WAQ90702.1 hypothetical protein PtA15_13A101 [Puccinia triticina]WAR60890.1 hypothetical protein PtB15_13B139 [Puccinia triticina]
MQIPSTLAFIAFLASFQFTIHAAKNPPLPNDYIIRQPFTWVNGYLPIYDAKGKEVFHFSKTAFIPSFGKTNTTIADGSFKVLFNLSSSTDNRCYDDTTYAEPADQNQKDESPKREFKRDVRAVRADVWRFNFLPDRSTTRQYYKFNQNAENMGGRIYKVGKGKKNELVGLLRNQKRKQAWLDNDPTKEVATFTLSCIDNAPLAEFVTLMALVFDKDVACRF